MDKKYYTLHFSDEGTGENFNEGLFARREDAAYAYNYPGYGRLVIIEVNKDDAISILLKMINDDTDEEYETEYAPYSSEFSSTEYEDLYDRLFRKNAANYIKRKLPGWELLEEEMEDM